MAARRKDSLLDKAASAKGKYIRYTASRENWFTRLERTNPKAAADVLEASQSWISGGQMRIIFARQAEFHRFIIDNIPECKDLKYGTFGTWLKTL